MVAGSRDGVTGRGCFLLGNFGDFAKVYSHFSHPTSNLEVSENPPGDFRRMFRHISKGSWTFSDKDHGWQVSDCTAESMKCCLLFSTMPPEIVGEKMEPQKLFDSVNILLSLQVCCHYMCNKWWLQPLTLVATIVEEEKKLAAAFVEEEMSLAAIIDDKGARRAAIDAYK
ncbi:hypothetical protein NC652_000598 [Populus alba x Populus x berolinensis]|nr:hypothetical protein NC652_000598 [Populus alba x Populus x berolinensis]